MRNLYLGLLAIIFSLPATGQEREAVESIAHDYYRINPFNKTFSSFVSTLLNDPALQNKFMERKTDSTLFFLEGNYAKHNPFFFKPAKVEVILTEVVVPVDSLPPDTLFVYQLIARIKATPAGLEEIKKEYERVFHRVRGKFAYHKDFDTVGEINLPGHSANFFNRTHVVSPFSLSWFGPDDLGDYCLALTIRLDIRGNQAVLPIPFIDLDFHN